MSTGDYFKHVRGRRSRREPRARINAAGLQSLLERSVLKPFKRISDVGVVVVPLSPADSDDADELPANPGHPACARYMGSDYCRESWQLHLAELKRRPETHWHTCDFGMFCAMVPVVHRGHCLAALRLACPGTIPEADFDRHVALLDVLVENFTSAHTGWLNRLLRSLHRAEPVRASAPKRVRKAAARRLGHPSVVRTIRYVEEHLSDPLLSVGRAARALDMHPNYLSHLFAEQVGERMCRFIASRRLVLAKSLLTTTDCPIKEVAARTGHAHPNWFSYIFAEQTGMTPGAYRRSRRRPKRGR